MTMSSALLHNLPLWPPLTCAARVRWLPYLGTEASPAAIGYSIRYNDAAALASVFDEVRSMSEDRLREREGRALSFAKTHYHHDGIVEQMMQFLKGRGDLRCRRKPRKPN